MVWAISVILAILGAWTLFNPFVGLIGVLGIMFVRPGELYPIFDSIHIERTFSLFVLVSFIVHQRRLQVPAVSKALLFLWGAMFCTVPLAAWRAGAFLSSFDFGRVIVYHFLIVNLATTARRFRVMVITICGLVAWLAASSFYLYYAGQFQVRMGIQRAVGTNNFSDEPNALGITLVTAIPLFLLLWRKDAGRIRWLMMPLTALCVWTVVLTGSRTSYINFAFLAIIFALSQKHRLPAALAVLLLLGTLWVVLPDQYRRRIATVENLSADASYQGRVQAWRVAWDMFKDNPLTGVGVGNFAIVHGTSSGHWLNVHSLYFQLLSEMGLVGVISFTVFVIAVFRQNWLLRQQAKRIPNCPAWFRHYPLACDLAFWGLLLAGYASHNLGRDTWYLLASLSAAAGFVMKRGMVAVGREKEAKATISAENSVGLAEVEA